MRLIIALLARLMGGTCLIVSSGPAFAQTPIAVADAAQQVAPATLVADSVEFDAGKLVAEGNVEIYFDGRILRATRVTYLRAEDRVIVDGPLTLLDGPDTILVADFASLASDLRNSVLQGARLVLDQRLQIAASEIATDAEGRYTQLYQTVASSCQVCVGSPVPLWQIRARRIVHDKEKQQLYFEGARFEVVGVPIAWFPRLRLPDPTQERTTGLLTPRLTSDDLLGTGLSLPYFIELGPSRDLTLTPFITNTETRSLGFRYRQAFDNGDIEVNGALSSDMIRPGETRGYIFAEGNFSLPRDYRLTFNIEAVSDKDYLATYGIGQQDLLESSIAITRVDREDRFLAEVIAFNTLRDGENNRFQPTPVFTIERQRRVPESFLGGQTVWTLQAHARNRDASTVPAGMPANSARDTLRLSAGVDWKRSRIFDSGLVTTALGGLNLDAYNVQQDPFFPNTTFLRAVPYAGLELRLPMARAEAGGVRHVIEPIAQVILAPNDRRLTPNEDSLTPEFDEGNLFSPSRFAGRDQRELGNRLNIGVSYTRYDPSGWTVGATAGRIWRQDDLGQFRQGTGLAGTASDWLLAFKADSGDGFQLMQRSLLSDGLEFSRSETILRWNGERHALETRYTWLEADAGAGRPTATSEWAVDASRDLGRDWTGRVNWRYDFITNDASSAGLGLTYLSDCLTVDFDVERRFTSTTTLQSSTSFGLGIELAGFGADDRRDRKRRCGI